MAREVTIEDLKAFKLELLEDIKSLLSLRQSSVPTGWLKSHQVRRILTLSPGKLLQLRKAGVLPYTRVGRTIYYEAADIEKLLHKGKQNTDQPKK